MKELLKLYTCFFEELNKIEPTSMENIEAVSDSEIDNLATDFNLFIPEDFRYFLKESKTIYTISRFSEKEEWEAGFDFCELDIIRRDIPTYRNELAPIYKTNNQFLFHLHQYCVPLSFSEPALVYIADPVLENSEIFLMLCDGEPIREPIAPDFKSFFTHWLASGCFRGRQFKKYWEVVKDFVPINIPYKENLWLNYYNNLYKNQYPIF